MSLKQNVYDSVARCAAAENIDKKILLRAKSQGCPGFRNSKVYFTEVKPWLDENLQKLQQQKEEDSIAKVKLENLKKDGILKELQIKEKEESLITVEEVEELLETIANAQVGLFNRIQKELPVKISGKTAGEIELELSNCFIEIVNLLKQDISKWK